MCGGTRATGWSMCPVPARRHQRWRKDGRPRPDEGSHANGDPTDHRLLRGHLEEHPQGAKEAHDTHAHPPARHQTAGGKGTHGCFPGQAGDRPHPQHPQQ
eukprot:7591655-Pyramimonas_sp.AAC.1